MTSKKIQEELSADICIIGGAGAGLCAAVRAKEYGAEKVLILEKMKRVGGCTVFASGMFAVDSPAQKRGGYFPNVDEIFLELMYLAHWDCNTKLVRKWYDKSGDIIRWMEDKGIFFHRVITGGALTGFKGYHVASGGTGRMIARTMLQECREKGVEIRTETRATKLLTNDEGAVVGVLATQGDKELKVSAKCVIIATGSISNNPELIARFYPPVYYNFHNIHIMAKVPFNTGDGLIMAEEIGADTQPIHTLWIGPHNHPYRLRTAQLLKRPEMIKLTRDGERYQDENLQSNGKFLWMAGRAQNSIPDRWSYSLCDESIFRRLLAERKPVSEQDLLLSLLKDEVEEVQDFKEDKDVAESRAIDTKGFDIDNVSMQKAAKKGSMAWMDGLEDALHTEMAEGRVLIANTLDEIAKWIGCDPETLKATVKEYNRFCGNGHDADFCKDPEYMLPLTTPPYYVLKGAPGIDTCIGGLHINHRLEVLNKEWKPIKGLLAAGVVAGGWLPKDGYAFAGSEMGFTCYSGYTAGENATKFVSKQV